MKKGYISYDDTADLLDVAKPNMTFTPDVVIEELILQKILKVHTVNNSEYFKESDVVSLSTSKLCELYDKLLDLEDRCIAMIAESKMLVSNIIKTKGENCLEDSEENVGIIMRQIEAQEDKIINTIPDLLKKMLQVSPEYIASLSDDDKNKTNLSDAFYMSKIGGRIVSILAKHGDSKNGRKIETIKDLSDCTVKQLKDIPGISEISIRYIVDILKRYGKTLKEDNQ